MTPTCNNWWGTGVPQLCRNLIIYLVGIVPRFTLTRSVDTLQGSSYSFDSLSRADWAFQPCKAISIGQSVQTYSKDAKFDPLASSVRLVPVFTGAGGHSTSILLWVWSWNTSLKGLSCSYSLSAHQSTTRNGKRFRWRETAVALTHEA